MDAGGLEREWFVLVSQVGAPGRVGRTKRRERGREGRKEGWRTGVG